jgi:hypothetical protein
LQPKIVGEFGNGVEGERQQVEGGEDGRQVLLSVAEIVLEVITLGFQGVEAFVLDLPARPATGVNGCPNPRKDGGGLLVTRHGCPA